MELKRLTAGEVEEGLLQHISLEDSHHYDLWEELLDRLHDYTFGYQPKEINGWVVEVVDQYGGPDQGSHIGFVLKVSDGLTDRYFEKTGRYTSFDGTYWDEGVFVEVIPTQKNITVYKQLKENDCND